MEPTSAGPSPTARKRSSSMAASSAAVRWCAFTMSNTTPGLSGASAELPDCIQASLSPNAGWILNRGRLAFSAKFTQPTTLPLPVSCTGYTPAPSLISSAPPAGLQPAPVLPQLMIARGFAVDSKDATDAGFPALRHRCRPLPHPGEDLRRTRDRVPRPIQRRQIVADQCAARLEAGAHLVDPRPHPRHQLLRAARGRGRQEEAAAHADLRRPARLRLREDLEIHLGGVAEVHRALSRRARLPRSRRLPGGHQHSAAEQR